MSRLACLLSYRRSNRLVKNKKGTENIPLLYKEITLDNLFSFSMSKTCKCSVLLLLEINRISIFGSDFRGNFCYVFMQGWDHFMQLFLRGSYCRQHFLYFLPLPHGQGSFLPTFFWL
jgi:hypothetical protein